MSINIANNCQHFWQGTGYAALYVISTIVAIALIAMVVFVWHQIIVNSLHVNIENLSGLSALCLGGSGLLFYGGGASAVAMFRHYEAIC